MLVMVLPNSLAETTVTSFHLGRDAPVNQVRAVSEADRGMHLLDGRHRDAAAAPVL